MWRRITQCRIVTAPYFPTQKKHTMSRSRKPCAIYHEHPTWFQPLFAELNKRSIDYVHLDASRHHYDVATTYYPYSLFVNRMSPSAYLRGHGNGLFYTLGLLEHYEKRGLRVINGLTAFSYEINKARQLELLASLQLPYPQTHVINHPSLVLAAAKNLRFPIVIKANIGGSGAGIVRYDTLESLQHALEQDSIQLGIDSTALVQEYIPARNGHITRVETLGGKYLYAIHVYTTGESFNLCPADICRTPDDAALTRSTCLLDAPKNSLVVEAYIPPPSVIQDVEMIMQAAKIDVGGIEYMIDDRDGKLVYYDINALSNFVANAPQVIGFDPHEKLVDFLQAEMSHN